MAFEATHSGENIEAQISRAENALREVVQETLKSLEEYRPGQDAIVQEEVKVREARARRFEVFHEKVHEKLMAYALLPSTLAFMGFGYMRNNADRFVQNNQPSSVNPVFESMQESDFSAVQSFAGGGMAAAAVAVGIVVLAAGIHAQVWARKAKHS